MIKDHSLWILETIQNINERALMFKTRTGRTGGWVSTRKVIFSGSYDVWHNEQDRINSIELPIKHLNNARTEGLIDIVSGNKEWTWNDEWFITPKGHEYLQNAKDNRVYEWKQ